ncbi:MAG TPA: hypothetical protein VE868_04945 [Balneolaceae bacterium]|nr:hypothetical protein [Balneolaceae bacterium]
MKPLLTGLRGLKKSIPFQLLLFLFLTPSLAHGQMFSVKSARKRSTTPGIALYAGPEFLNFKYKGNVPKSEDGGLYSFNAPILRLRAETRRFTAYLGASIGLDSLSYFDIGLRYGHGFIVYHAGKTALEIPLQLHGDLTDVTDNNLVPTARTPHFQQAVLDLGTGIDFRTRLAPQFRLKAKVLPSYGVTFSTRQQINSGNTQNGTGTLLGFEGNARLYFDNLLGFAGLSVGYNYSFRKYNIDGELLDYNAIGNSILIGITF